jgi:predicted nucleic acid-binding protein
MSYVLDASCLIYLGKLGVLEKIKELPSEKYVPPSVYHEVVVLGLERKEPEAVYLDELIQKKVLVIRKPSSLIEGSPPLTFADREALSLAKETRSILIMDELYARALALKSGIEIHGSLFLFLELIRKRAIAKREAMDLIDKMIALGFYLSAEKYKDILKIVEEM